MMKSRQSVQVGSRSSLSGRLSILAVILTLSILSISMAEGQTFTVLHQFTGGGDGAGPAAGVTIDQGGNLYGTSAGESINGAGNVYELKRLANGGYTLVVLHDFQPTLGDGGHPLGRVIFGPDGRLYGMTSEGANNGCLGGFGCGMVFALQPPRPFVLQYPALGMKQSSTYSREMQTGVHLDTRSQCLTEMATFMERHSTGGPDPLLRERYSCFSLPAEVGRKPCYSISSALVAQIVRFYWTTQVTCTARPQTLATTTTTKAACIS
jgi:hypothetical protein